MSEKEEKLSFLSELRRRKVFRAVIAYALLAWILLQIADVLFPALTLPDWTIRFVAALLILGFPLTIFFAWAYELTPEGIKRERDVNHTRSDPSRSKRKADFVIISMLLVAVAWFALDRFVWQTDNDPSGNLVGVSNSIAVLPFVNISSDTEQEYFSDGLTEELLNHLAKVKELRVIGRTSSFQFKSKNEDLREIGKKLDVTHILEGSVRKSGNKVRITAQLIDSLNGIHIWSETYDENLDDIFAVQDSIATSVATALRFELLGETVARTTEPKNVEAYDLYLKGLRFANTPGPQGAETALDLFLKALALDPDLAPAWQQLAAVYASQTALGVIPPEEGIPRMNEAIDRALELDPLMASAYYSLGYARMNFDWDWEAADAAFTRALEIDPNHPRALGGASMLAAALGRSDEAIEFNRRSLRVDPLNLGALHGRGFIYYLAGEFERAEAAFREALAFAGGNYPSGHTVLTLTLIAQGKVDEAYVESQKEINEQFRMATESLVYFALDRIDEADVAMQAFIDQFGDRAAVPIGGNFAYRGDKDAAFEWYERAYEQHDAQMTWTKVHPMNANLRGDPRFDALLEKLELN